MAALPLPADDTDGDGLPDFLDLDSDQDGLSDIFEAGGIDSDNDGLVDDLTDDNQDGWSDAVQAAPLPLTDTDVDGAADYLDLDSDNDGLFDLIEAGGADTDDDGLIDLFLDSDGDSIPDQADIDSTEGDDSDGDGIDDLADASITLGDDINNNGIDDSFEADPDGNGRATLVIDNATLPDTDSNGVIDVLQSNRQALSLITGVSGGPGCSIGNTDSAHFDPLFIALATGSLGLLGRRRLKQRLKT